jgi:NADH-quinone oxidoreductase subunit N
MNVIEIVVSMLPENLLLAGIVLLIGQQVIGADEKWASRTALFTVLAATAFATWISLYGYAFAAFPGHFSVNSAAYVGKAIVFALAVPVLLISRTEIAQRELHILVLSSLYGVCLLLSSDSFLTLFLGLEIMSLPVYALVLLAYRRPESAEAALKYLVLGGAATATLLMGVALLYGGSGSLGLAAFPDALRSAEPMARMAAVLIIVAFFLKGAVVPFHAWAPDAYEAAAIPVTAYMATIVKAGVLLAAVRLFGATNLNSPIADLLALLPLISIVWGNLAAMRQQSFRRMIAYSSIAHAGYLFYAFLGDAPGRFQAVAFYIIAYGFMNLLAFAAIPPNEDDRSRDRLDQLQGLFHRRPWAAVMIAISMLSLAGIPPFPGFVAKFLIFKNVISAGHVVYGVLGLVGSYLGIYFYLRVIQFLFMSPKDSPATRGEPGLSVVGAGILCAIAAGVLLVFPGWVMGLL